MSPFLLKIDVPPPLPPSLPPRYLPFIPSPITPPLMPPHIQLIAPSPPLSYSNLALDKLEEEYDVLVEFRDRKRNKCMEEKT